MEYFFDQQPQLTNQKIGTVGKGTSDAIRKYGKRADFIGYSTDTKLTGKQFASQVKPGGFILLEADVDLDLTYERDRAIRFGIEAGNYQAQHLRVEHGDTVFDVEYIKNGVDYGFKLGADFRLPYPGMHNVKNALAALAATTLAGGNMENAKAALAAFKGVKRRFETIVKTAETVYVDDYAHHPAELEATIQAARSLYPGKRLTGVFQPHLFTRTRDFADAFATALDKLDECLLLPIYPARELPIPGVTSEMLLDKMTLKNKHLVQKNELLDELKTRRPELLLTLGAGDIDTLIEPIKALLTH